MRFTSTLLIKGSLDSEKGSIVVTPTSISLTHYSDKKLIGEPRLVSDTHRLIPESFSLGRPGSMWSMWGNSKARFKIKAGSRMLVITKQQFYNWGAAECTPIERGLEIRTWARDNDISVIKMQLAPIQDVEYAVIDLGVLVRI